MSALNNTGYALPNICYICNERADPFTLCEKCQKAAGKSIDMLVKNYEKGKENELQN